MAVGRGMDVGARSVRSVVAPCSTAREEGGEELEEVLRVDDAVTVEIRAGQKGKERREEVEEVLRVDGPVGVDVGGAHRGDRQCREERAGTAEVLGPGRRGPEPGVGRERNIEVAD